MDVFLFFLLRSSNVFLNNYAETAFLKRYGVEYLPIVYMLNSIALFFIMGAMTGIMVKLPGTRILSYLFMFCGVSVAKIRFLIPLNIDIRAFQGKLTAFGCGKFYNSTAIPREKLLSYLIIRDHGLRHGKKWAILFMKPKIVLHPLEAR